MLNSSKSNRETAHLWTLLENVKDPEIPVISIRELGVLRDIEMHNDAIVVTITPTYSGCPAMREIRQDINKLLGDAGFANVVVETQLSPAWTSEWIGVEAAKKLNDYGISPPVSRGPIKCPQCDSSTTTLISEFGSTACKALYKCQNCLEPFDYFKCI